MPRHARKSRKPSNVVFFLVCFLRLQRQLRGLDSSLAAESLRRALGRAHSCWSLTETVAICTDSWDYNKKANYLRETQVLCILVGTVHDNSFCLQSTIFSNGMPRSNSLISWCRYADRSWHATRNRKPKVRLTLYSCFWYRAGRGLWWRSRQSQSQLPMSLPTVGTSWYNRNSSEVPSPNCLSSTPRAKGWEGKGTEENVDIPSILCITTPKTTGSNRKA